MRAHIEQAVTLLQENRPGSIDRVLALLQDTVFAFSMKVCGHREDAEDTMQDVLLKSVRYLPTFDSPKALAVWLYKVARNRCLMSRRRSKFAPREHLSLEELMPDRQELETLAHTAELSPEQSLLKHEDAELVRESILRIPAPYRLVLVLHDMEELSSEEVAKVTGLREGTVRVRLHRARLYLRKELSKRTKTEPGPRRPEPGRAARPSRCKQMFAALSDYLDGALDPAMCENLENHIGGCPPCEAFLASLKNTIQQVRQYQPGKLDARTAAEVRDYVLDQYRRTVGAAAQARSASE